MRGDLQPPRLRTGELGNCLQRWLRLFSDRSPALVGTAVPAPGDGGGQQDLQKSARLPLPESRCPPAAAPAPLGRGPSPSARAASRHGFAAADPGTDPPRDSVHLRKFAGAWIPAEASLFPSSQAAPPLAPSGVGRVFLRSLGPSGRALWGRWEHLSGSGSGSP